MPEIDVAVHQTLGQLLAEVENLNHEVSAIRTEMHQSEQKSDASRSAMHRRVDELVDTVGKVETGLAAAQKDITDMKPVTEDVRKWKLMGIGALGVVGIGGTAIGVALAGALENIAHLLRGT